MNASGEPMHVEGLALLPLSIVGHEGASIDVDAIVAADLRDNLLISWHDLVRLNVLPATFPCPLAVTRATSEAERLTSVLFGRFPDVMQDILKSTPMAEDEPMHVFLQGDVRPFKVSTPRKVPLAFQKEAEATIQDLLKRGVVAPVTVPTAWCSPCLLYTSDAADE